jgi:hypothetical protein
MNRCIVLIALLTLTSTAVAHGKHVHGEARLEIAIDKESVELALEMPLDSAVGFEHAPKDAQQKAALEDAVRRLGDAGALWRLTAQAGCTLKSARVETPQFGADGHADLDADYVFQCAHPGALKSIETTLFKAFPRLHRIESQWVGPAGQGARTLTPKQPALKW